MRKTWKRPELVVLVRSKPEERVLDGCKGYTTYAGISTGQTYCQEWGNCGANCSQITAS